MSTPDLSQCCHVPLRVKSSNEGTSYYECTKCGKPADPARPGLHETTAFLVKEVKESWSPIHALEYKLAAHCAALDAALTKSEEERDKYRIALEEIVKGEGPFNRDQLIFANNVIDHLTTVAEAALNDQDSDLP